MLRQNRRFKETLQENASVTHQEAQDKDPAASGEGWKLGRTLTA